MSLRHQIVSCSFTVLGGGKSLGRSRALGLSLGHPLAAFWPHLKRQKTGGIWSILCLCIRFHILLYIQIRRNCSTEITLWTFCFWDLRGLRRLQGRPSGPPNEPFVPSCCVERLPKHILTSAPSLSSQAMQCAGADVISRRLEPASTSLSRTLRARAAK